MKNNKKTVLFCDDDEGIMEVTKIILEEKGYRVIACLNCDEIYSLIEKEQPSLILMDLWMPNQSGDKITKLLKENDKTKHIPVIIVSASKDALKVAKDVGAEDCLTKPFDITELEEMVDKYLSYPPQVI